VKGVEKAAVGEDKGKPVTIGHVKTMGVVLVSTTMTV
jgi:hypothetical protein